MDINKIKKELEEEISLGNLDNYRNLKSFLGKIYRNLNKEKVSFWNDTYRKKVNKHKKTTLINEDNAPKEKKSSFITADKTSSLLPKEEDTLDIF